MYMMGDMDEVLTTEQVANMIKPKEQDETSTERRIRFTHAARKLRARGVEPLEELGAHGQRLWPRDKVLEALSKPKRLGNRTSGPHRSEAGKRAWATRVANGSSIRGNAVSGPERSEAVRRAWVTRRANAAQRSARIPDANTPSPDKA